MNQLLKSQLANHVGSYQSMNRPQKPNRKPNYKPSQEELDIFRTAKNGWDKFSKSRKGRMQLATAKKLDLPSFQKWVKSILGNSEFRDLRSKLSSTSLPFKSFSIGINFEIEFIIGFSGTVGIAIGIGESKGKGQRHQDLAI